MRASEVITQSYLNGAANMGQLPVPFENRFAQVNEQLADMVINVLYPPGPLVAAVGDGVTDDTAALLAVKSYILANGGIFYVPATANCFVSGDLDLFGLTNIRVEGMISGTGTDKILTVGYTSNQITATNYFFNNANNIMLRFTGLKNADSKVNQCSHVQLWADGDISSKASLAYCRFTLGIITKLEFNSQGGPIGWINENVFYGGRISELVMDGNYQHNNNRFIKPMFDSGVITINKGGYNQWIGCRFEGTPTITFATGTTWNRFVKSWYSNPGSYLIQTAVPNYTDNGSGNKVTPEDNADYSYRKLFEINARSSNYNTARFTRNAETITGLAFSNVWESDYIKLRAPLGFQYLSDAALFRASVYFYNAAKTLITVQPAAIMSGVGYTWITDHYINSSSGGDIKFALFPNPTDSTIVYAKIILQQYAAGTFEAGTIKIIEQKGRETNITAPNKYQRWIGTAAPTAGSWEIGDIIYNSTPTAGGYVGWVCIATGSPGTWKGFGAIQA